jgi:hypothetical protein
LDVRAAGIFVGITLNLDQVRHLGDFFDAAEGAADAFAACEALNAVCGRCVTLDRHMFSDLDRLQVFGGFVGGFFCFCGAHGILSPSFSSTGLSDSRARIGDTPLLQSIKGRLFVFVSEKKMQLLQ